MLKRVFSIPLIVIVFCSFTLNSKAEFNINVGDEFQYNVQYWNWEAIIGSNSSSFQGFTIDNHLFNEGDDFLIEVINMDDNFTADYRIIKDGYSINRHTEAFGVLVNMLLFVGAPTGWFVPNLPWNETRIQEGPRLDYVFYPFYDNQVFEYFERKANNTYISSLMTVTYHNYSDIQITYNEKKGLVLYEQYLNYDIKYTSENYTIDFTSESNLLFSIDKTTGVLHGFRMACRESGLFNGTYFDLKSEGLLELKGYNMPKFDFGDYAGLPGFTFYIIPITLITLVMIRFQTMNKRKKH